MSSFFDYFFGSPAAAVPAPRSFEDTYKAFPISFAQNKGSLEDGNKVILPVSALEKLTRMNTSYPMFFRIVNPSAGKFTHCGVMEFSAPEGCAYLPQWMMNMLQLEQEDFFFIRKMDIPKGEIVTFQPHFTKFTELSNPRAVLERALKNFACLTKGDTICITHGDMIFPIDVTAVAPDKSSHAISVLDTDLKVDFEEPQDYQDYLKQKEEEKKIQELKHTENSLQDTKNLSSYSEDTQTQGMKSSSPMPIKSAGLMQNFQNLGESPSGSSPMSRSQYFQNLGTGYRVKDTVPLTEESPQDKEQQNMSTTISVVKGQWRYIYQVDPNTKARKLLRRIPAKQSFNAFSGSGNSLS